jgi:hypothetical protein
MSLVLNSSQQLNEVMLQSAPGKLTSECFVNRSLFNHRNKNLDVLLPKVQHPKDEKIFVVSELVRRKTILDIAYGLLGRSPIPRALTEFFTRDGHAMSLPQIENLIERQESGEDIGLITKGMVNLFFVESDVEPVSVICADRHNKARWDITVHSVYSGQRWAVGYRYLGPKADPILSV